MKHIYTYSYIKTSLIEEPLTKYNFIVKNAELIDVYQGINRGIEELTVAYVRMNEVSILENVKKCFSIDWTKYNTVQPVCSVIAW